MARSSSTGKPSPCANSIASTLAKATRRLVSGVRRKTTREIYLLSAPAHRLPNPPAAEKERPCPWNSAQPPPPISEQYINTSTWRESKKLPACDGIDHPQGRIACGIPCLRIVHDRRMEAYFSSIFRLTRKSSTLMGEPRKPNTWW